MTKHLLFAGLAAALWLLPVAGAPAADTAKAAQPGTALKSSGNPVTDEMLAIMQRINAKIRAKREQQAKVTAADLADEIKAYDDLLAKHAGMTWPQYFAGKGWGNKLAQRYGVEGIPFTILVGADGKIIGRDLRGAELGTAVAQALKK